MARKTKTKTKAKGKTKPEQKPKAKPKKRHGERVAIYFGKKEAELLTWARDLAKKRQVGLNRIVQDGLRLVYVAEIDVHHESDPEPAVEQKPGMDHAV